MKKIVYFTYGLLRNSLQLEADAEAKNNLRQNLLVVAYRALSAITNKVKAKSNPDKNFELKRIRQSNKQCQPSVA
jgi:hypothetical protein